MLNYKKILLVHIFLDCAYFGFVAKHDSYHIFLAIASVILAYAAVSLFISNKIWMLIFFVLISVTVCQLSVTGRKAVMDEDFKQQFENNPTGVLVGDVLHGFKRMMHIPTELKNAFVEVKNGNTYSLFENMNYRYLTMFLFMPLMAVFLVLRKSSKERPKETVSRRSKI